MNVLSTRREGPAVAGGGADGGAPLCGAGIQAQYTTSAGARQIAPPDHLTLQEASIWRAAEVAKQRGDYTEFCRLRRQLLRSQAARYEAGGGRR